MRRIYSAKLSIRDSHTNFLYLQLWMMKGQIEEEQGNREGAREAYKTGVSISSLSVVFLRTIFSHGRGRRS